MSLNNIVDYEFIIQIMERLEFFNKFNTFQKQELARFHKNIAIYEEGENLISESDHDASLYILLSGKVHVTKGQSKVPLAEMGPGEIFGEISFTTKSPRTANVKALEKTIVIKVSDKCLSQMQPELREKIKDKIIEKLVSRLEKMNQLILEHSFN